MVSAAARIRIGAPVVVAMVLAAIAALFLIASGAPWTELSADPDEASHFVTSMMIRSYLIDGFGSPREFAAWYYIHYPKVAFGIWPPLFHVLLAAWMYLFGVSYASALIFTSLITVAAGMVIFLASRTSLGTPLATVAAAWFIITGGAQQASMSVMLDMLCAFWSLVTAVMFGRYLDSGRPRDIVRFAVCASIAILTKNNAFALALLPPLAIVIGRRWSVVRRPTLWWAPVIVCAICGPWYIFTWHQVGYVATMRSDVGWSTVGVLRNVAIVGEQPGFFAVPLAIVGLWDRLSLAKRQDGFWLSLLALVISYWTFHSLIYPIFAERYLLPVTAGMVLFSVAGLHRLAEIIPWSAPRPVRQVTLAAAALALFAATTLHIPVKPFRGFADAADTMLHRGLPTDTTALVSSDTIGEGAFVSHITIRKPQPQTIILRASKLLATGTWIGIDYAERYPTDASLAAVLDRARVEYIALDDASREAHHEHLRAFLDGSHHWNAVTMTMDSSVGKPRSPVRLYTRRHALPPGQPELEIDLSYSLGTTLRR